MLKALYENGFDITVCPVGTQRDAQELLAQQGRRYDAVLCAGGDGTLHHTVNAMAEAGESLTAEVLKKVYYDLNCKYFGPDMVSDEEIALEWCRIPHFYMNFYVYQYATGFSAAVAIARRILKEGQPAVEDYMKFLSGGCSKAPVELLKIAGVDMTTKAPIQAALDVFGELLDEMETLI